MDAEDEPLAGGLDCFRELVEDRYAGHLEAVPDLLDALVMMGLDPVQLLAGGPRGNRPWTEPDVVIGVLEAPERAAMFAVPDVVGEVLAQRAAKRDVEQLHAPADAEHRHVPRGRRLGQRQLGAIALGHYRVGLGVTLFSVRGRIDVAASGEHQRVREVENLVRILLEERIRWNQQREPASPLDGGEVLLRQQGGWTVPSAPACAYERGADRDGRPWAAWRSIAFSKRTRGLCRSDDPSRVDARGVVGYAGLAGYARRASRRTARLTLPLVVFGSSAAKSTMRGYLYGAV